MAGRRLQGGAVSVVGNLMLEDRKRAQAREDFDRRYQIALSAHTTEARTHLGGELLKRGLSPSAVMQFIQSGQIPAMQGGLAGGGEAQGLSTLPPIIRSLIGQGGEWSYTHPTPGGGKFTVRSSKPTEPKSLNELEQAKLDALRETERRHHLSFPERFEEMLRGRPAASVQSVPPGASSESDPVVSMRTHRKTGKRQGMTQSGQIIDLD